MPRSASATGHISIPGRMRACRQKALSFFFCVNCHQEVWSIYRVGHPASKYCEEEVPFWGWRVGSVLKNTCCSCRGTDYLHGSNHLFKFQVNTSPPSGLWAHQAHMWYTVTCKQNTQIHKTMYGDFFADFTVGREKPSEGDKNDFIVTGIEPGLLESVPYHCSLATF